MDNKQKALVLVEFINRYFNDDEYNDFFDYNDIGVPMSIMIANELVSLHEEGQKVFDETWKEMCELLDCDPNGEYESLEDII
jgi:hypothetical protein